MIDREGWLLTFLSLPGGPFDLTQIRVMKGLFLWSQEGPMSARALYDFRPYHYGPFDTGVYRDLESLQRFGYVVADEVAGTSQRRYRLTGLGQKRAAELAGSIPPEPCNQLAHIKMLVTSVNVTGLLKNVYERYPKFAAQSVARV